MGNSLPAARRRSRSPEAQPPRVSLKENFVHEGRVEDYYDIEQRIIGRGSFANVKKCRSKETGAEYAVKIIPKYDIEGNVVIDVRYLNSEIAILKRCHHPHILQLQDVFETDEWVFLVMELAECGSLRAHVSRQGSFSEADASRVVRQLAEAVAYLHSMGVVHRDLKPENCLLARGEGFNIKVADFGLSKLLTAGAAARLGDKEALMQTACGSRLYAAPEVLRGEPYDGSVDLWGIGITMFIVLSGEHPFPPSSGGGGDDDRLQRAIRADFSFASDAWDDVSVDAKRVVERLLAADPRERMTLDELVEHPWIRGSSSTPFSPATLRWVGREQQRGRLPSSSDSDLDDSAETTEPWAPPPPIQVDGSDGPDGSDGDKDGLRQTPVASQASQASHKADALLADVLHATPVHSSQPSQ